MYRLENIKIRENLSEEEIIKKALKQYKINENDISEYSIFKCSIDARNKNDIYYNYTIDVDLKNNKKYLKAKHINNEKISLIKKVTRASKLKPVIVGSGPAGLFCALTLAYNGLNPILIEQGKCVEERQNDVDNFIKTGKLNKFSNVQFGEGGAGTFSDGKLTSGISSNYCKSVLEEFVKYGAPTQILYTNKPHIGTDNLINIIANIRNKIVELGGIILFQTKFIDFDEKDGSLKSVKCKVLNKEIYNNYKNKYNQEIKFFENDEICINTDCLVLAIGHSARDTFEKIYDKNIKMEKKNFSVGVRIEHKQNMINLSQYGDKTKLKLPPAEYKLAYHGKERSCYTFCMCPGGEVIASSSEEGTIVTNGMSKFARDGVNANSAVLVNVVPEDFKGDSPLEGIYFQKELEEKAFILGGSNYFAPVQRVEDFIKNVKTEKLGEIHPTYMPGVTLSNLNEILPGFVSQTLKEGIIEFDKKIKGFANPDSVLTGVETRSSSPVKIIRDIESLMSNIYGIYPCGEGAGYAGGIMSAAVDGIKCAMKIIEV